MLVRFISFILRFILVENIMTNPNIKINNRKNLTENIATDHIRIKGDFWLRIVTASIVGLILIIVIVGGIIISIYESETSNKSDNYWRAVFPILSGAICGFMGFIVGKQIVSDKNS